MNRSRLRTALLVSGALFAVAPIMAPATLAPAAVAATLPSFAELVTKTRPAVVTVRVEGRGQADTAMPGLPGADDPAMREFMERFFGKMPNGRPAPSERGPKAVGLGSGFIIDAAGLIVTNNHVIDGAEAITVILQNGDELTGTLVGRDEKTDLAVVSVKAGHDLPTVPWGDSDAIQVGDWAVAIGNPFGFGGTVTAGIVSARGRDIHSGPYDDFIQVDAAINRGNSGGPLFDQDGYVIGVNTAIFSPSGGNVGVGFAIPTNQARAIVGELIKNGSIERGWLGVSIQPVTREIADSLGLAGAKGALVSGVVEDGPAKKAGLKLGDVVLRFGGTEIATLRDLTTAVAQTAPKTETQVVVWRGGKENSVTVHTGTLPVAKTAAAVAPMEETGTDLAGLGLSAQPGNEGLVVTEVDPASDAASKGMLPGDVIVSINQEPVLSVEALSDALDSARANDRKSVLLLVARGGDQRFVTIELSDA
ncbi:MAG TPA: Do family serine endopeptidase [Thermohalobaculum sp.]|nr:Do family serine endopeptidase [Thermohalobaculum sp.]